MQKHIQALKKKNKILFNRVNNTSTRQELNKTNNINKANYDSLGRNVISFYSESDYTDSSLSSLSEWEVENKN